MTGARAAERDPLVERMAAQLRADRRSLLTSWTVPLGYPISEAIAAALEDEQRWPAVVVTRRMAAAQRERELRAALPGRTIAPVQGREPHPVYAHVTLICQSVLTEWADTLSAMKPAALIVRDDMPAPRTQAGRALAKLADAVLAAHGDDALIVGRAVAPRSLEELHERCATLHVTAPDPAALAAGAYWPAADVGELLGRVDSVVGCGR